MACSKYTLTNTGSTITTFNYRRCDDAMWEYQIELEPNQVKNIWLVDNTYSTANTTIVVDNQGSFPPAGATPTPTPTPTNTPTVTTTSTQTPTPSVTAEVTATPTPTAEVTPTPTPSVTAEATPTPTAEVTATPTPTETPAETPAETPSSTPAETPTPTVTPTQSRFAFTVYPGTTSDEACGEYNSTTTIWGDVSIFDNNNFFFDSAEGPVTTDMSGFYKNSGLVTELDSNGIVVGGTFDLCVTLTPTPTPTITPTQTIGYYSYNLGYDATLSATACGASPSLVYGPVASGPGPNVGETLYSDSGLTTPVADGYYSDGADFWNVSGGSGLITSRGNC